MAKDNICVIYDDDESYAKRLMGIINDSKDIPYRAKVFTKEEEFNRYILANKTDVLMVNEEQYTYGINHEDIKTDDNSVIVLCEDEKEAGIINDKKEKGLIGVCKYQPAYQLLGSITRQRPDRTQRVEDITRYIGVYGFNSTLRVTLAMVIAADYFLQRREMGCINIGGKGIITVDGTEYEMNPRDGIYIGMGNKDISFKCVDIENPPKFYVSSCPAHTSYPVVKIDITKAKKVPCGSKEDCNKRVINQYIHPEVMQSCQLAMGLTMLDVGSNWNTMPCHTHDRRMEVYLYLDMDENDAVFHMMGEPDETRHIIMHNEEAVISPSWSIHTGVATKNYSFIWAMCGENQEFDDMDFIETKDLK